VTYPGFTPVGNATLVVANVLTCNKHSQFTFRMMRRCQNGPAALRDVGVNVDLKACCARHVTSDVLGGMRCFGSLLCNDNKQHM
jgi:hypothetical protein